MPRHAWLTTCGWGPGPPGDADPVESNLRQAVEMIDRAALVRLREYANTIEVMVPTIRRQQAMDLRGIELRPVG